MANEWDDAMMRVLEHTMILVRLVVKRMHVWCQLSTIDSSHELRNNLISQISSIDDGQLG